MNRWSTSAASRCAIWWMVCSSPVRNSGIVVTRTAPAFEHAEPGGGQPLVVGAAQEHAVPGHDPEVLDEDPRDPIRRRHQLGV